MGAVMPKGRYRGVSLADEVVKAIEDYMREHPEASYKSIADFVSDAIRVRFEQLGVSPGSLTLLDIKQNERVLLLYDQDLRKTVQIYISPKGIECGVCKSSNCRHVRFALSKTKIKAIMAKKRAEGWNV